MICLSRRRQGNKFYVLQRPCQTFELIQLSPRSAAPARDRATSSRTTCC